MRDKAVRIDTAGRLVTLATGQRHPYDVLAIVTGADYQEPARFTGVATREAALAFTGHQQRAASARSALVVGGGPSGVELAAELRLHHPGASVTLAHSGPHLLPKGRGPRLGRRALAWLEAHDVRVHLDTFVSSAGGGPDPLRDQRGRPFGADLVYWTTGTTPNSLWLRLAGLGHWLDTGGRIRVDEHLRVAGLRDVYAVGDVNNVAEAKLSPSAMAQGRAAAHNIRAHFERTAKHGRQPRAYTPAPVRAFSVPFGPEAGVTLLPALGRDLVVLGDRPTAAMKGRALMVPWARGLLRQHRA